MNTQDPPTVLEDFEAMRARALAEQHRTLNEVRGTLGQPFVDRRVFELDNSMHDKTGAA